MAEVGFYIDTGAREEEVEEEDVDGSEDEDKVLGSRDAAVEKRQRERAARERNLSSFLFGKLSDNVKEIVDSEAESDEEEDEVDESDLDDNDLEVDSNDERVKSGNEEESEDENSEDQEESSSVQPSLPSDVFGGALNLPVNKRKRKAAWVDKDDADIKVKDVVATYTKAKGKHGLSEVSEELYGKALNRKFKSVVGEPAWASLDKEEGGDSDEEFLRETTNLTQKRSKGSLAQGKLVYRRLKDLNGGTHKEGAVIRATEFHPTSTVGLVAGNNGTATLFQVDGKENPKIQTINFQNFPIRTAKFSKSGTEFIVGSQQHPHYFVYDMMIGKSIKVPWRVRSGEHTSGKFEVSPDGKYLAFRGAHGNIHIVSARTKELLKTLKMNDECQDMVFSGSELWTTGAGGEVYMWDLRTFTALNKFTDDGSLSSTALAISPHYLATGSSSGVVNIYSLPSLKSSTTPKPEKILLNLTTVIEVMEFNPSGEALVMASTAKEGAAKIVHFPSMTVFENFPGSKNLARVNCVGFRWLLL